MARWRVNAPHYIHAEQYGEPTSWVREETNRDTGRAFRRTFTVPLLVDPNDPTCINKHVGYCVVATPGTEQPGDIVLSPQTKPTPDMEPLDAEARQISDLERPKWKSPIDNMPITLGEDFSALIMRKLEQQINDVTREKMAPSQSLAGAGANEIAELKAMIAEQARLLASVMGDKTNVEAPLEEIDPDAPPTIPPPTAAPRPNLRR